MDLQVTSRLVGRHAIVAAEGEIDLTSCVRLRDTLDTVDQAPDADTIVVDLSEVGFIDSTGLSVLVDGARNARGHDRGFGVVADGHLRELLRITGLDTVMDVHRRLDEVLPASTGAAPPGKPVPGHEEAPLA